MAFQGLSPEYGKFECLLNIKGTDLLGLQVEAPLSSYGTVYVLPMLTILPTKGSKSFFPQTFP